MPGCTPSPGLLGRVVQEEKKEEGEREEEVVE
jgi:hypothetical protein